MDKNDIINKKSNKLTVVSYAFMRRTKGGQPKHYYNCICDCGKKTIIVRQYLVENRQETCGCEANQGNKKYTFISGDVRKNTLYNRWTGMLSRCYSKKNHKYSRYGGRGIKVEKEWHDFKNFYHDMGYPKSKEYSLDRIDVNGNYCKENCRWATQKQQQNNRANNIFIEIDGINKSISEWSLMSGISVKTIRTRIIRDKMEPKLAVFREIKKVYFKKTVT